jgi:hypothetical protein
VSDAPEPELSPEPELVFALDFDEPVEDEPDE